MNQDWEKIGKDLRNIVEDAVNSQDFSQLNRSISNTINEAVSSIQEGMRTAGKAVNDAAREQKKELFSAFQESAQHIRFEKNEKKSLDRNLLKNKGEGIPPNSAVRNPGNGTSSGKSALSTEGGKKLLPADWRRKDLFQKNTSIKAGGLALAICGCVFNVGLGLAVVILILVSVLLGGAPMGIKIALSVLIPFLAGSAVMTWKGTSMLSAVKRYRSYVESLQGRTYCNIKELAARSGKSISYVVKDVRKMIGKGWFRQGHLNHDNTCLIVSHETYQEYEEIQRQRLEQQAQEQAKLQEQQQKQMIDGEDETFRNVIEEGEEYIRKIRLCSENIPGTEIAGKISHMEMLIQKIFDRVKEDPDSLEDIGKLMEYYLPTTVKLLDAYQQLCSQPVQGENIRSSRLEIEQALNTLNDAFEKLLDSLFEDVAWDVSSDISVLNTMLAQEGLMENEDWKIKKGVPYE